MSLILDALNRSRQDTDEVPGLATQHYMASDFGDRGSSRQYPLWLALLLAVLVIGWLIFDRYSQPVAPVPVTPSAVTGQIQHPTQQSPQPAAVQSPADAPAITANNRAEPSLKAAAVNSPEPAVKKQPEVAAPTGPSTQVVQDDLAAVADLYQQEQPAPTKTGTAVAQTVAKPAEKSLAPQPSSQPTVAKEPPVSREEQPIDIQKIVLKAREEVADSRLQEHPAPFIISLSQQTKNAIPTIYYQQHDYSDKKGQSVVVLNGKKVRAGGSPVPGLKVDEILPDSVVLSYRGTQFRLRALNSWINL